jgi:hypothetical protein
MATDLNLVGPQLNITRGQQFIPETWLNEILHFRKQRLLTADLFKAWESDVMKGDVYHIPRVSELGVHDKASDTAVSLELINDTDYTITVDTDRYTAVATDILLDRMASYDVRKPYMEAMGYALAKDVSAAALGMRAALNANPALSVFASSNGAITGNGTPITFASILTARRILLENDVMDDAEGPLSDVKLVVSPAQETALMNIQQFISRDFINDPPLIKGFIGTIMGIPVIRTNMIGANSATGYRNGAQASPSPSPGFTGSIYLPKQDPATALPATFTGNSRPVHTAMLVHRDWAGCVMSMKPTFTDSFENREQVNLTVGRQALGMKLYRPNHGVLIHTTGDVV